MSVAGDWRKRVLVIAALGAFGCGRGEQLADKGESASADATPARSEIERGPVRVTVEVEPSKARLSDEPTLTLTIDHERGVTVRKPPFGEALGDFVIRDFREPLPEVKGDREIVRQIYTLEPTRVGPNAIAPVVVSFTDTRPNGDGKEHVIETEAVTVEIASMVEGNAPSLLELRPAEGPTPLPAEGPSTLTWLALVIVVIGAFAAIVWWRMRRGRRSAERSLTPHELAYLELQRLIERDLARSDVKAYYVELTGIVRRYIERTTGIDAPDRTTEEFLREVGDGAAFEGQERARLGDFLESADLVKFAAHQPRKEDIERSFRRAKVFIGLEREEEAPV